MGSVSNDDNNGPPKSKETVPVTPKSSVATQPPESEELHYTISEDTIVGSRGTKAFPELPRHEQRTIAADITQTYDDLKTLGKRSVYSRQPVTETLFIKAQHKTKGPMRRDENPFLPYGSGASSSSYANESSVEFEDESLVLPSAGMLSRHVSNDAMDESLDEDDAGYHPAASDTLKELPDVGSWTRSMLMARMMELEAKLGHKQHRRQKGPPAIKIQMYHVINPAGRFATLNKDSRADIEDALGTIYLDEPIWEVRQNLCCLRARFPIANTISHSRHAGSSFAVYHIYNEQKLKCVAQEAINQDQPLPSPVPGNHRISLISDEMKKAMRGFVYSQPGFENTIVHDLERTDFTSPFVWWYHCRKRADMTRLPERERELILTLTNWLDAQYGPLYDRVNAQFSRGKVSLASMDFMVQCGDVLISTDGDGVPQGHIATSTPVVQHVKAQNKEEHSKHVWNLECRMYGYKGGFFWKKDTLQISFEAASDEQEVDITSLQLIPLQYASAETQGMLHRRGETFWKCRDKHFISYKGNIQHGKHAGQRFMVDFRTYNELHPDNSYMKTAGLDEMAIDLPDVGQNQPPGEPQVYLFPPKMPGFDLRYKKWVDLEVDQIRDIQWNKDAFDNLVFDEDMKTIILALVTNQLDAGKGTDLIDNKGNGLIMLLHGSPGTGKTYTAESVAEIAKKPLYPVTCGDIGTEPEVVEKYLERVFHLGKVWDCVVLLDEAELFLEQRTLSDLKRNALVSVFLRALEYYEGILILTTNRVGTFDEAFKSRIQLALRYEKLRDYQRKQIWRNFFNRLRALGEEDHVDFDDVTLHIDDLVELTLNGRQIRNTITTARQLAKFMGKKMTFSHLKRAITVAEKFDTYLASVREGEVEEAETKGRDGRYTDEFFARSDLIR